MSGKRASDVEKRVLQPLELVGYFWTALGAIVLGATIFVREGESVTHLRGVVVNLSAALFFLGVGITCIIRGRKKNTKSRHTEI